MELFDLEENAMVRSADGEALGEIERFVVNPSSRQVSHLVVKEGLIFKNQRVVPVEQIDHIGDEGPVLSSEVDPDQLQPFETEHYVPVDEDTRRRFDARMGSASLWRYPTLMTGYYPGYPGMPLYYGAEPRTRAVTDVNVPDENAIVDEDTPVESLSGEQIGTVSEVTVDGDGRLSHMTIDLDSLSGERVVPAHLIDSIGDAKVALAVGTETLQQLEQR